MIDKYTEQRAQKLHPKLRAEVIQIANELAVKGLLFRIVQGFRSSAEQDALYAQTRKPLQEINRLRKIANLPPINEAQNVWATNGAGGYSYHCFGLAVDFAIDIMTNGVVSSVSFDTNIDTNHDGNKDFMEVINAFGMKGWQSGMFWKKPDTDHVEKTFGLTFQQLGDLVAKGKVDTEGYVLF